MPEGTDPAALAAAARAFAAETLGGRFEYVLALHTDTDHPHVHLTVRSRGVRGERFNPKKGDLDLWRQAFARALRDRGIEAEATPRRARGITRKAEAMALRKLGERLRREGGPRPWTEQEAVREAAGAAFGADGELRPWEAAMAARQAQIRALYLAQARLLAASPEAEDRALAAQVQAYVREAPAPDSRRLAVARALREVNARLAGRTPEPPEPPERQR
jgi:type IV secretory pathway VirD2 relaxase